MSATLERVSTRRPITPSQPGRDHQLANRSGAANPGERMKFMSSSKEEVKAS
jgi:hypothetical protein